MSNEISKFYQFLAKQGQNWTEVADSKYGNDDGSVIKAEFKNFINAEWNGEEMGLDLTTDLVNKFWKKIDTNQSTSVIKGTDDIRNYNGLDDKEIENMETRIVAYQQVNEYSDEYIKSPGVFTSSDAAWKNDVETELMTHLEEWINNGCQGDLTAYLEQYRPSVENKYTAQYCAIEYQNELLKDVLKDYPEYKIGDDSTLQDMLQEYLNGFASMETQPSPETIKNEIRSIIDAYFATAGIGNGSDYDLSSLGYTQNADSPLNDIQKAKLTAKLKSNLAEITSDPNYEKYKDLYDEAINDFISGIVDSTKFSEFETVLSQGIEEFKATDEYKTLMNRIEVTTVLGDLSVGSYFYNAIKRKLGQTLADKFSQDAGVLPDAFNEIINQAIEKVLNGEFLKQNAHIVYPGTSTAQSVAEAASTSFTSGGITINPTYTLYNGNLNISELLDWVTDQLAIRLDEIYTNGYGEMELEELNNVYDKLFDTADELQGDEKLSMYRNTAINYIEALMDMGYADALKDVIGDDYKAKINQMLPSDINDLLDNIKQVVDDTVLPGDSGDFSVNWNPALNDMTLSTGGSTKIGFGSVDSNGKSYDASKISYSASGSGLNVSVDGSGNISISAGDAVGVFKVSVSVLYDGQPISQISFNVTVEEKPSYDEIIDKIEGDGWGDLKSEHLEVYGLTGDFENGKQIHEYSFADLYNNDAAIQLHRRYAKHKDNNWNNNKGTVITRLNQLGDFIATVLATAGLNKSILDTAVDNVVNNLIEKGPKYKEVVDDVGNWVGDTTVSGHTADLITGDDSSYRNTIVEGENSYGTDTISYQISFRDLVDLILAEYENLGGGYVL